MQTVTKKLSMCAVLWLVLVSPSNASQLASLSWTANTEPDLAGYTIYRSSKPCTVADDFAELVKLGLVTTYTDSTIPDAWTSACYTIDARDTSDNTSGKSQIVSKDLIVYPAIGIPTLSTTATAQALIVSWPPGPDGAGGIAKIDIRYAIAPLGWGWGSAVSAVCPASPCTIPVVPGTYDLQAVFYRGVMNQEAVFGVMSQIVQVKTPVVVVPPIPGAEIFTSLTNVNGVLTFKFKPTVCNGSGGTSKATSALNKVDGTKTVTLKCLRK